MSGFMKLFSRSGTFKKHHHLKNTRQACLIQHKRATLNAGDFSESLKLPPNTDLNDWLAANIVDFFNELCVVTENVLEYCNEETCPTMSASEKYQYLWADGKNYKTPTKLPARQYIELLYEWVLNLFDDQNVFPPDPTVPFPKNFKDVIKQITKRLFRVYAHIYHHHLEDVRRLNIEAHFNTAFRHFYTFIEQYNLMPRNELEPLRQVILSFQK